MYEYEVKEVVSVYDGDTVTLVVDLGFGINYKIKVRLFGIDTPEMRGDERPQGIIARDWLRERLANAERITIKTVRDKQGKYGRYLGMLHVDDSVLSVNAELVTEGMAVEYMV